MKTKKSTHPLAARVKKMMQADEDIGKIAQASPVLVGEYSIGNHHANNGAFAILLYGSRITHRPEQEMLPRPAQGALLSFSSSTF